MKRTRDKKNEPSWLEKELIELLKTGKVLNERGLVTLCGALAGKPNASTTMAALRRLLDRGILVAGEGFYMLVDRDAELKKKRAKMTVALAEKYGGVLFENDVWCFLGTDGADKFAYAVRLEGLEVKRWRDDMAEKAQIVYA